ncbi:MAG: LysR family transcriptional regulator [Clostridia bacterium]|nr:LysR family transcriptional regulator [Clostridia bacterium]
MRIQDWELICCLHDVKSLSKASDRLFTTQPVLTRRLKQIEDEMDTVITYRSSKGLTFTPEGELLWKYCQSMLEQYQTLKQSLRFEKTISGTLQITCSNSIAQFFLPELLRRFKSIYPQINFEVESYLSHDNVHRLNDRSAQIAFFCGDYTGAFKKEPLYTHFGYIVSNKPFTLQELPELPLITYQTDHHTDGTIEKWWYDHFDTPPYTAITVRNSNICFEMVRCGLGYGLFLNADQWRREKNLCYQQLFYTDGSPVSRTSYIGYRENALSVPNLEAFIRFTREYAQEVQSKIPDLGVSNF